MLAFAFQATGGARPPVQEMTAFVDQHRAVFGVGPICRELPIAPSTYYARAVIARDPDLASDRTKRDRDDSSRIERVFNASGGRYGPARSGTRCAGTDTTLPAAPSSD